MDTANTPAIKTVLNESMAALVAAGSPSPYLDAEVLMMYVLGLDRAGLYLRLDARLTPEHAATFSDLLARRLQGEPVAYITRHKEFMALDFAVDARVLIPRPETELLVELTVKKLAERGWLADTPDAHRRIVDVGTGSGVIAIYLALRFPHAQVAATDISPDALEVARANARSYEVEDRMTFVQGNLLEPLDAPAPVIVSNPPYTILDEVEPNVARYEPRLALDGGPKGLFFYRALLAQARQGKLAYPGLIAFEIGHEQAADVRKLGTYFFPQAHIEVYKDYAGFDRVVLMEIDSPPDGGGFGFGYNAARDSAPTIGTPFDPMLEADLERFGQSVYAPHL